jgi:hypothetical protein
MRISDDRYHRDVRKYNLALRLIHHEARTGTIRAWTGLSGRAIRNLFRSYVHGESEDTATRHRGPPPQAAVHLLQSSSMRANSELLASLLCLFELVPGRRVSGATEDQRSVIRGERLCTAFEMFSELVPHSSITLEHALLLLTSISRGDELELGKCASCAALTVVDHSGADRRCGFCRETDDRSDITEDARSKITRRVRHASRELPTAGERATDR